MASQEETPSKTSPEQIHEVQEVKNEFGQDCRVISDIGDFAHIIEVKLPDHKGVHIAFQLNDTYPKTAAHVIVKSKRLSSQTVESLALRLAAFTEKHAGELVLGKTIKRASLWLKEEETIADSDERAYLNDPKKVAYKPQRKGEKKSKAKKNVEKQLEKEGENQKLSSMKTAMDVVSRVLWDESLNKDDFIIGYLDRMMGVVEKDFDAFSWEDIASVDYNTLAIPKHRIQYYKYKGILVWDKKTRLDDVFGSTGGKTIDQVIEEYRNTHQDDGAVGNDNDDDKDDYNDDSDDDGIEIDTGNANCGNEIDETETEKRTNFDQGEDHYWGPKKRPTHFLCLRVTDPEIVANVSEVHKTIREINPNYEECIIPTDSMHITLACLGLDTEKDVENAVKALADLKGELVENWQPGDMSVTLNDVGNFFHNVLYARVECTDKFMKFVHHLRTSLQTDNVELRDVFEFTPHMTLMKLKRQLGREVLHTRYLDQRFFSVGNGCRFGTQVVDNVYLCEMSEPRQSDGFYISPTHLCFNDNVVNCDNTI